MVPIINRALDRLSIIELSPHSALYKAFFAESPVYRADQSKRRRQKRCDGATNVITQVKAIVWYTDIVSNFIARPIPTESGKSWERKTMSELNELAFGGRVEDEVSLRRTERAVRELCAMGYMNRAQWRKWTENGYRSEPGLKWLTDKFWRMLGLMSAVADERGRRKAAKEAARAIRLIEELTRTDTHAMRKNTVDNASGDLANAAGAPISSPVEHPPPERAWQDAREAAFAASRELLATD